MTQIQNKCTAFLSISIKYYISDTRRREKNKYWVISGGDLAQSLTSSVASTKLVDAGSG